MLKSSFLILFLVSIISNIYSQKEFKGIPNNLNRETIIFLEYEQIPIDTSMRKVLKRMYRSRNIEAPKANKQLHEEAKNYPFKYVISKRSAYKDSLINSCRYVLENDIMEAYNNGVNLYAGYNTEYKSPMYILDLKTGDKYKLFDIETHHGYYYKYIMRKFIKKVNKKFKW